MKTGHSDLCNEHNRELSDMGHMRLVSHDVGEKGDLLSLGQNGIELDLDGENIHSGQNKIQTTRWQKLQSYRLPPIKCLLELGVVENS